MSSREERLAHERQEFGEWHEADWREANKDRDPFATPGSIIDHGEPGPYVIAEFISPCVHGDVIWSGDTIRADGTGEWEHRECAEEGGPMFDDRGDIGDYDEDDCTPEWTL